MAMIKRADADTMVKDALVLDLGDLHRQGERLRARAEAEAERIVVAARAERDRIMAGAAERGHAEGLERGLEEGITKGAAEGREAAQAAQAERLDELARTWAEALDAFIARRERMLLDARADIVRLAAMVARKVTKRVVELDPSVVEFQLTEVLAMISRRSRLVVTVCEEDKDVTEATLPAIVHRLGLRDHVELTIDGSLERGSCLVRTAEGGEIEATIDGQLDRIVEELLRGVDGGGPGEAADA